MKKSVFILLAVILGAWIGVSSRATAKVYIDIQSPSFRKFPIAISPFKVTLSGNPLKLGEQGTDILNSDLDLCGFFALVDPKSFKASSNPNGSPSSGKSPAGRPSTEGVDLRGWANTGAEALVLGDISYRDKSLVLEARLFDVVQKELIVGKRYVGEEKDLSRMVHRFADEIILALTGEKGFFQTKIAFVSKVNDYKEIFLMDFDGRNITQLTRHHSICLSPRISPDGTRLAFTSYKAGNPDLYIKNLATGEEQPVSSYAGLNITPAWSPDGQRLALTLSKDGNPEIYIMNLATGRLLRVTDNPAIDVSPNWSPDGKKIAFVSDRGGTPQIYIMNADGTNPQRLTFEGIYNTHPAWAPRGDRIAYDSAAGGGYNICTVRTDGLDYKILTANMARCEMPSWSPDGRHLIFTSDREGDSHLYLMDAEGTRIKRLTFQKGGDTYPNWSARLKE